MAEDDVGLWAPEHDWIEQFDRLLKSSRGRARPASTGTYALMYMSVAEEERRFLPHVKGAGRSSVCCLLGTRSLPE
jgi:hypothetical protein